MILDDGPAVGFYMRDVIQKRPETAATVKASQLGLPAIPAYTTPQLLETILQHYITGVVYSTLTV